MKRFFTTIISLLAGFALGEMAPAQTVGRTLSPLPDFDSGNGPQARIDTLTVSLVPGSGAINGRAGSQVGWGFKVSWASNAGDYLVFTGSSLTGDLSGLSTSGYQDLIGDFGGNAGGAVAPGTVWETAYAAGSSGLGGLRLRTDAKAGVTYSGQVLLKFAVIDGPPDTGKIISPFSVALDVSITVAPGEPVPPVEQVITFAPVGPKTFGGAPFALSATADSGLPVTFTSQDPTICTVEGSTVTILAPGSCSIVASQEGDEAHHAALPVIQTFEITKAPATVSIQGGLSYTYDGTPKGVSASTAPGALAVRITYNGDSTPPAAAGQYTVLAQIDDASYQGSATATLAIARQNATVNWAPPAAIPYGSAISATQLNASATVPGTLTYLPELGTKLNAGAQTLSVTFVPADAAAYPQVLASVPLTVSKIPLTAQANSVTQSHRQPFPTFTGTVSGTLPGDEQVVSFQAAATIVPGTYPITPVLADTPAGASYDPTLTNGTLTLTNETPVAVKDSYQLAWNTPVPMAAPGVLGNDTDGDGDDLTATIVTPPAHGKVTLSPNGSFNYVPAANYQGADSFTYRAGDGFAQAATQTVAFTIKAPPRPAVARSNVFVTFQNVPLRRGGRGVLANDGRAARSVVLLSAPAHGTLTLDASGGFLYVPAPDYVGPDRFVYATRTAAGVAGSAATVNIVVRPRRR